MALGTILPAELAQNRIHKKEAFIMHYYILQTYLRIIYFLLNEYNLNTEF